MNAGNYIHDHLKDVAEELGLEWPERTVIEPPREKRFGDLACNLTMLLSRQAGQKPVDLAQKIKSLLEPRADKIDRIEIAGP